MYCFSTELLAHRRQEQGLSGKLLHIEAKQNVQTRPVDWQSKPSPGCFLYPQQDFFMLSSLCSPLYRVPGLPSLPCCGCFCASPSRRSESQLLIFTSACKQGLGSMSFTQTCWGFLPGDPTMLLLPSAKHLDSSSDQGGKAWLELMWCSFCFAELGLK